MNMKSNNIQKERNKKENKKKIEMMINYYFKHE